MNDSYRTHSGDSNKVQIKVLYGLAVTMSKSASGYQTN